MNKTKGGEITEPEEQTKLMSDAVRPALTVQV